MYVKVMDLNQEYLKKWSLNIDVSSKSIILHILDDADTKIIYLIETMKFFQDIVNVKVAYFKEIGVEQLRSLKPYFKV